MMKTDGSEKILANFAVANTTVGHQFRPLCSAPLVVISGGTDIPRRCLGNKESCSAGFPKLHVGTTSRLVLGSSPASQIEIAPYRRGIQFFLQFCRPFWLGAEREGRKRRDAHRGKDGACEPSNNEFVPSLR